MRSILSKSYHLLGKFYNEQMSFAEDLKVLDIGCGYRGNFTRIPANIYKGIDTNQKAIDYLRQTKNGEYRLMDALKLKFKDLYFDYIISTSFFHHLSDAQVKIISKQMKRVLKNNGKAIIADGVFPESKLNILGRLVRLLDRGRYVRHRKDFREVFLDDFNIEKERYFVEKIFAYCVLVMSKK